MNNNTKIKLKLYGLICLIVVCILFILAFLLSIILGASIFKTLLKVFIPLSFILTIILKVVLLNREKNNPVSKKYSEMLKEIQTNGYSDRFFRIVDEGAALCAENGDRSSNYYISFMLYGASAYSLKKDFDNALRLINSVDTNLLRTKEQEFLDNGEMLALYFDTQMCISQLTGDLVRAENIMADAQSYIDKYYKAGGMNIIAIEDMYCAYYYLKGDFEKEYAHASKLMNSNLPDAVKNSVAYMRVIEVCCKIGQRENAQKMYDLLNKLLAETGNSNREILMKYADDLMAELN